MSKHTFEQVVVTLLLAILKSQTGFRNTEFVWKAEMIGKNYLNERMEVNEQNETNIIQR